MLEGLRKMMAGDQSGFVSFGPYSVRVKDYPHTRRTIPIADNNVNLRIALQEGIVPLSVKQIISQLSREDLSNAVLFDTPPIPFGGNHFRILEINRLRNFALLQLCGIFGNHDFKDIPPLKVELGTPMFTGVSIQNFEAEGTRINLQEVIDLPLSTTVKNIGETIYWSLGTGTLKAGAPKTS